MNIQESSLSRILQHINRPDTTLAVVAAFLESERLKKAEQLYTIPNSEETLQLNLQRHERLRDDIRADGLGYIEVDSGWAYSDAPGIHKEKAFMVPNMSIGRAQELCARYMQECVLFKDNTGMFLMTETGEKLMEFGKPGELGIKTDLPGYSDKGQAFGLSTRRTPQAAAEKEYTTNLLKQGFSALIRANKSKRGARFSFVRTKRTESIRETLLGLGMGRIPKIKIEKL